MGHLSSMFNGLARSFHSKKTKNSANKSCEKDEGLEVESGKKTEVILSRSGIVKVKGSKNLASVFSKRGQKGINQDCCAVWEEYGCQEDMIFCGIFDGHGPWGHFVAKTVRDSLPSTLLHHLQQTLAEASHDSDKTANLFNIWKHSYTKTCAAVDKELERNRKIDTEHSGTTALTIVRQGDVIYISNVGDSRAVLAKASNNGELVPVQLTIDFKPNLPQETARIIECHGRVYCMEDEPGVHRVWLPDRESPGLAISRAFGDYCIKDFGLISVPEVTQRQITFEDQFVVLATDGVWDVISNQEAIQIVSMTPDWSQSAKNLVKCAAQAWKRKRKGIAMDDISAIVLFFHSSEHTFSDATLES